MEIPDNLFMALLPVLLPVVISLIGGFAVLIWRIGVIHTEFKHLQKALQEEVVRGKEHEQECAERMRRVYTKLDELGRGVATIESRIDAYGRVRGMMSVEDIGRQGR